MATLTQHTRYDIHLLARRGAEFVALLRAGKRLGTRKNELIASIDSVRRVSFERLPAETRIAFGKGLSCQATPTSDPLAPLDLTASRGGSRLALALRGPQQTSLALELHPGALSLHDHRVAVVEESVEDRSCEDVVTEDGAQLRRGLVGREPPGRFSCLVAPEPDEGRRA